MGAVLIGPRGALGPVAIQRLFSQSGQRAARRASGSAQHHRAGAVGAPPAPRPQRL